LKFTRVRKCKERAILAIILLTLFLLIATNDFLSSTFRDKGYIRSEFVHHESIVISNDNDFKTQNWPGDGTIENPYIIEGLNITTNEICISISSTSSHFIIRDCFLRSLQGSSMCCIQFHEVANGSVIGCKIDSGYMYSILMGDVVWTYCGFGIRIQSSDSCNFTGNILFNNYYAVSFKDSSSCVLEDNQISQSWEGISIEESVTCIVNENNLFNNRNAILLKKANSCIVSNQIIDGSGRKLGLHLVESTECQITNNRFKNSGISFDKSGSAMHWNHTLFGNTVNGQPIRYFHKLTNSSINVSEYGQLILAECNNVTANYGLFTNTSIGVQFGYCVNSNLENSAILNNSVAGLALYSCSGCGSINNSYRFNFEGVYSHNTEKMTIAYNNLLNNWRALDLWYTSYSRFYNNTIEYSPHKAVYLEHNTHCDVFNNTVMSSNIGIDLWFSEHCKIVSNRVFNCSQVGIRLTADSMYNRVYYNLLGCNGLNGEDHGSSNTWDDGSSRGNSWSDYSGEGWYEIKGTAGSYDRYPSKLNMSLYNISHCTSLPNEYILILTGVVITAIIIVAVILWRIKRT
jgi:parallel beta-helix repeat protein